MYWAKDDEDEAARQEQKRKALKKIHGCSKGGHAEEDAGIGGD